jgi:hypothetical protein
MVEGDRCAQADNLVEHFSIAVKTFRTIHVMKFSSHQLGAFGKTKLLHLVIAEAVSPIRVEHEDVIRGRSCQAGKTGMAGFEGNPVLFGSGDFPQASAAKAEQLSDAVSPVAAPPPSCANEAAFFSWNAANRAGNKTRSGRAVVFKRAGMVASVR